MYVQQSYGQNNGTSALLSGIVRTEEELERAIPLRSRRETGFVTEMVSVPRFEKQPTIPAIYKLKIKNEHKNATFSLIKDFDRLPEPPVKFGDLEKIVNRTWNTYTKMKERGSKSFAIAATGYKGMGKTDFMAILANKAIDNGMIVVMVTEIKASIELVKYLSTLDNVFLIYDEFGKNFSWNLQEKMLTMFNNLEGRNRFMAITENRLSDISDLFLDRPGRIHYLLEFETTDNETIEEYCKHHKISKKLTKEILLSASKIANFSFDFLKGIEIEHSIYPDDSLEEMLKYLNLKKLQNNRYLDIYKIEKVTRDRTTKKIVERVEYDFKYKDFLKEKVFKNGRYVYLEILGKKLTEEEKAKIEEEKKKAQEAAEAEANNGGNTKIFRPGFGVVPLNGSGNIERMGFNINQLEFVEKYDIGTEEYTVYSYGEYYITIGYRG